ncbi:MAG: zinc ribbon domain-containing protein [Clostridia bacterium]|nr:zinc ribbon domain-containing protein [Clostridia bacterium]
MALINCIECGKEISDKAKSCPHCGMPLKKKGRGFAIASLVLGIIGCVYSLPVLLMAFKKFESTGVAFGRAMYFMIFGVLSVIFGVNSHLRGCHLKKKTAGIVLGTINIVVLSISIIISIL